MKIAVATEDGQTVAPHFGKAPAYLVITVAEGAITDREMRPKAGHHTFAAGPEPTPREKHVAMADAVGDCEAVVAGGMGPGARRALEASGLTVVLTGIGDANAAAVGYAAGTVSSDPDRTCDEGSGHRH